MTKKEKLTTMKQESIKRGLTKPMSSKRPKSWEGGSVAKQTKSADSKGRVQTAAGLQNQYDIAIGTEALRLAGKLRLPPSKAGKLAKGIKTRGGK